MNDVASNTAYTHRPVALIVGSDAMLSEAGGELIALGFEVISAPGFATAKSLLLSHLPDVLITEVRLGEYNGLHLVLRGKAARSEMAALVYFDASDPVLAREADHLGATILVRPVPANDFVAAIWRTRHREVDSPPIRPPFERRTAERRQLSTVVTEDRRSTKRRRYLTALGPSLSALV